MTGGSVLGLVLTSGIVLVLPGPSVVFVVTRTLEGGRRAGLVSVLGLEAGLALHVVVAGLGLTALMASSDLALDIVSSAGACYLAWLGVRQLLRGRVTRSSATRSAGMGRLRRWRLFREAMTVDSLNPQTALFVLALLTQFVDPTGGAAGMQLVLLGAVLVIVAAVCDSAWVLAASVLLRRRGPPDVSGREVAPTLRVLSGLVYLALAVLVLVN